MATRRIRTLGPLFGLLIFALSTFFGMRSEVLRSRDLHTDSPPVVERVVFLGFPPWAEIVTPRVGRIRGRLMPIGLALTFGGSLLLGFLAAWGETRTPSRFLLPATIFSLALLSVLAFTWSLVASRAGWWEAVVERPPPTAVVTDEGATVAWRPSAGEHLHPIAAADLIADAPARLRSRLARLGWPMRPSRELGLRALQALDGTIAVGLPSALARQESLRGWIWTTPENDHFALFFDPSPIGDHYAVLELLIGGDIDRPRIERLRWDLLDASDVRGPFPWTTLGVELAVAVGLAALFSILLAWLAWRFRPVDEPALADDPPTELDLFSLPEIQGRPPAIIPVPAARTRPLPPRSLDAPFPANLPRGIGIVLLRDSERSELSLPPGWKPGDPVPALDDDDPLEDTARIEP